MMFELYSDFMCPACKNLHENVLPSIIRDYRGHRARHIWFSASFRSTFRRTCIRARRRRLAVAAARIGKYQTVSDALFRSQQSWGTSGKVWETVAGVLDPGGTEESAGAGQRPGGAGRRAARCRPGDEGRAQPDARP